jgi:CRISPR-associated protein Csb1
MSSPLSQFDHLLQDNGPAAVVLKQWLRPVGDDIIYPPTYANPSQKKGDPPVYNIDRFGHTRASSSSPSHDEKRDTTLEAAAVEAEREHSVAVLDSIPSQANRIEPAFTTLADPEGRPIKLVPRAEVRVTLKADDGSSDTKLVNLLEAGHRIADAVVRFSNKASEIEAAFKARMKGDSLPVARLAPTSLVFGVWDSRGSGVKIPRLINSIIRGYGIFEYRRSAQFFPAVNYSAAGVVAEQDETLEKLSEEGMAEVPATFQHGGIEARGGICRDASLNLCTLREIKAGDSGETRKLQRYVLGLALVAITHHDGKTLNLRQGCQLVADPSKPMTRKLVHADGTEQEFKIDRDIALSYAKAAADDFGIGPDWSDVAFDPRLAKGAVRKDEKRKPRKAAPKE